MTAEIRIGTARWGRLAEYGTAFEATEINSSFYRHHRPSTYERWALTVPRDFRFSVKVPKSITHEARLDVAASEPILGQFLDEVRNLRFKLGPLLVQLPPSLEFDPAIVDAFLAMLRRRHDGFVACEPRHASWFDEPQVDELLVRHRVARVAADPAKVTTAAEPGGWPGLAYIRLHGSPRMYHSSYDAPHLAALAERIRMLADGEAQEVWCIFDNTASGAALDNARDLQRGLV